MIDFLEAQKVIEALRTGIPPEGMVRHLTVGRQSEIDQLHKQLEQPNSSSLLVQANYGAGKTHLLRYIREAALDANYAVSMITLDAKSGIAFNKLDQIFGDVCRRVEIPTLPGQRSIRHLLNYARQAYDSSPDDRLGFWFRVSNQHKWDYDHLGQMKSPSMYLALRAWCYGDARIHDAVEDWLFRPASYSGQKSNLYRMLIGQLRSSFRDPRSERQILTNGTFDFFKSGDYERSWDALDDLNTIARACGFRGLVILVDEFEDVISNITRKTDQQDAFWRLFEFFGGSKFAGLSFFAVTPDFVERCKSLLIQQNIFDFDYSQFEKLPMFRLSPLTSDEIIRLKQVISELHFQAFQWTIKAEELMPILQDHRTPQNPDGVRILIKDVIHVLDRKLEERDGD